MTDPVGRALRDHVVANEPPLRLNLDSVLRTGRRSLRYRRAVYCGGAAAVTGALVLAVTSFANGVVPTGGTAAGAPTFHVPEAYDCFKAIYGAAPTATTSYVPFPAASLSEQALADRVSCYLMSALPAALPGATFSDNPVRRTPALVAAQEPDGFTATATVSTSAGSGLVIFNVGRTSPQDPLLWQAHCAGPYAKATCRTGPHGEMIEVFDFGTDPVNGHQGRTIYLYSGHTFVLAGAHNMGETDGARPTMAEPPLTVDQLIAIAAHPALLLYP